MLTKHGHIHADNDSLAIQDLIGFECGGFKICAICQLTFIAYRYGGYKYKMMDGFDMDIFEGYICMRCGDDIRLIREFNPQVLHRTPIQVVSNSIRRVMSIHYKLRVRPFIAQITNSDIAQLIMRLLAQSCFLQFAP